MSVELSKKILPVKGIRLGTAASGERYENRDDLLVVEVSEGASSAAVFTRNVFCAAPVIIARRHMETMAPRYLIVNAGNANAGTGIAGEKDCRKICDYLAKEVGWPVEAILPFSTGVIGQLIDTDRIGGAINDCLSALSENNWAAAGRAIMTTDTCLKARSATIEVNGALATVTGIAKGSGMIKPDMATMLAFVATDAAVSPEIVQLICEEAANVSFNRITVDGDTSTNDAFVLMATGARQNKNILKDGDEFRKLAATICMVCTELAKDIVRDGEGATKFVTITVYGEAEEERSRVAYAVAESPLVKTALFASDANWGRILAAVGRSIDRTTRLEDIDINVSGVPLVKNGQPVLSKNSDAIDQLFAQSEIEFSIHLDDGASSTSVWTCDYSYEYIRINAEYRT
jgi:glutamate N-acetyltransferase/amino-acid N-acetyltransferase